MLPQEQNAKRPARLPWLVAVVAVAVGWLVREAVSIALGHTALPFIFFFPAIAVVAWYGGLRPAVLAVLLSAVAADWYLIGPAHTLVLSGSYGLAAMTGYFCSCAFIVAAIEAMHRAQRRLLAEITRRTRTESALAEDHELLATTLASIGDAVIATDADGRIRFLNSEAERLTGWTTAEASGQSLPIVFRIINEETRQPVDNPVATVLQKGKMVGLANHTVLVSRGDMHTPIDDSAAPIRHSDGAMAGVILVFRDVSERRNALKTSARLAAIVEFSGDAILTKDLNGVIQTWNAGAERLFGHRAEEIIGRPITVLFPPDRLNEEDDILRRLRSGLPVERLETIRVTKDGRPIPVSVSISPIRNVDGAIIGASKIVHDISDLAAAKEALIREKELLATTLASIGDAVVLTDAHGRVTFLNREAERLTGWTDREAAARPLLEVFHIVNEVSRAPAEDPVSKALRFGAAVGLANHTILIAKDGRETPIDDSAAPIRQPGGPLFGVVLVFRDFSERRRNEQQQQRLYSLVQAVNQARALPEIYQVALDTMVQCLGADRTSILSLDPDGVMRFKAWSGLSDEYRRAIEGHSPWPANHRDPQPVCINDAAAIKGELGESLRREGIRALAFIPITYEGNLMGKFMVYYNQLHRFPDEEIRLSLTVASQVGLAIQRRQAEQELERLVHERTAKLQEMMGELQHVSYAITHDMRAPLRAMSTFAGIISSELSTTKQASPELLDACRRIIASAGRLDQLIQDALNYTKAVLQQLPLHPVDLAHLIPSLLESYPNLQADKADIIIPDPLPVVQGEESLLTQCFSNLLGNAVKFVSPGVRPEVHIRVVQSDGTARITVSDNGIGIPHQSQKRLFRMFERLTSGYEGTGIGLAIVRKVVERMGGRIGVESEPGAGSHFWVELRLATPMAESRPTEMSHVQT